MDLENNEPSAGARELGGGSTAHTFGGRPLGGGGDALVLAIGDALNTAVLEDISFSTGMPVRGAVGDAERLSEWVEELYGAEESLADVIADAAPSVTYPDSDAPAQSQPAAR